MMRFLNILFVCASVYFFGAIGIYMGANLKESVGILLHLSGAITGLGIAGGCIAAMNSTKLKNS